MKRFRLETAGAGAGCWRCWCCRFIGSPSTWLTLTVAGLAMGMIIFIIASGLTLVFGLMDVLNFGHGVFIALGAFVATSVLGAMGDWTGSSELWRNLVAVLPAMLVAMAVAGAWAWRSSASSCARCTASTSSRSSSPWAA
jgi:branched-subunit amino acid ABC-type transport system permease component